MNTHELSTELRAIASTMAAIMAAMGTLTPDTMELALLGIEHHLDRIANELEG